MLFGYKMFKLRQKICDIGNRLWMMSMLPAGDGNISVRLDDNRYLITPSGISKGFLEPGQILLIDGSGKVLDGKGTPSSEIIMHLVAYRLRGDVNAVVHAHPPYATSFSCTNNTLPDNLISEGIIKVGKIPTAPFAIPSSKDTAEAVAPYFRQYNAVLLKNHGAVSLGKDLDDAFLKMELVEHISKIAILTNLIDNLQQIPEDKMKELLELARKFNT